MKNRCICLLVSLFSFLRKSPHKKKDRFLVVSSTALGDTLWSTPSIRALREKYPKGYIGVLTSPIGKEIFKHCGDIDDLFVLQKTTIFQYFSLYRNLKQKEIDTVFILHTSQRCILPLCAILCPRMIIGSEGMHKGLDSLLTKVIPIKKEHEIKRRFSILSSSGIACTKPDMEIFLHKEDYREMESYIESLKLPEFLPIIGIHPGAKDRFKQWDPDCFIEAGRRLAEHTGAAVIVTGTSKEKTITSYIASHIPGAYLLPESFSIRALAALMKKFSLFITNDTGPMHVAFASKTPTLALFAATDAKLCGPYNVENTIVIQKLPTCSPCIRKQCQKPFCLLQISPEEVFDSALQLFYREKSPWKP